MLGADVPATMKSQGSHNHHQFDSLTELVYLEQTGNVQGYYDAFILLRSRVEISEDTVIEMFLRGLETEIEKYVRLFSPRTLKDAYFWARLKEFSISISHVKEDVVVDELGAETELGSVMDGSENAIVSQVFEEMPKKNVLTEVAGVFEQSRGWSWFCCRSISLGYDEQKVVPSPCCNGTAIHIGFDNFRPPANQPWRINCEPESPPKAGSPIVNICIFIYPRVEKGNLRLGSWSIGTDCLLCCLALIRSDIESAEEILGDLNFGETYRALVQQLNGATILVEFDSMDAAIPSKGDHNYDGDAPLINITQLGSSESSNDQHWCRNYEYKVPMAEAQRARARPHEYPSRHKCNLRLAIVGWEKSLLLQMASCFMFTALNLGDKVL